MAILSRTLLDNRKSGFTLIEVLLSLIITSLTVIAVMSLLSTGRTLLHGPEILEENHRRMNQLRTGLNALDFTTVFSWIAEGESHPVAAYSVWVKAGAPEPFTEADLIDGAEALDPALVEERAVLRDLRDAAALLLITRDQKAITRPIFVANLKASSGRDWQDDPITGSAADWEKAGLGLDATIYPLPSAAIRPEDWETSALRQRSLMTVPLVIRR
jgi:hypothetical protein